MAEDENTPQTPQEPAVSLIEAPEVESVPAIDSTPDTGTEGPSLDSLRAEVEQASSALRTSEDLRQQLHTQLDDAEARIKAVEMTAERERVARKHGIPDDLVGFLRGESAEQLEAEAAKLGKYSSARLGGLGSGGLDPTDSTQSASDTVQRLNREARAW